MYLYRDNIDNKEEWSNYGQAWVLADFDTNRRIFL